MNQYLVGAPLQSAYPLNDETRLGVDADAARRQRLDMAISTKARAMNGRLSVSSRWMRGIRNRSLVSGFAALACIHPVRAEVQFVQVPGALEAQVDGVLAASYATEPRLEGGLGLKYKRGAFLHPVFTPSSILITDAFSHDHGHQTGFFTAWTKAHFRGREVDFWNLGKGLGRVEPVSVGSIMGGAQSGRFEAQHRHVALVDGAVEPVLDEVWQVVIREMPDADGHVIDLEILQRCASKDPLELDAYHYGGFAYRGAAEWLDKPGSVRVLTSEGETDRVKVNESRVRWCYLGGPVGGRMAGVAMLSHPENLRSPQPIRVNPTMPMVCFAPEQLGPFAIGPDAPLRLRYRLWIGDGEPDQARINALWQDFAAEVSPKP